MSEEITKRKIMIVIEDDGVDKFNFYLDGDCERLNLPSVPASLYSPAEHFAVQFFKACHDSLNAGREVKKLNREERRAQSGNAKP